MVECKNYFANNYRLFEKILGTLSYCVYITDIYGNVQEINEKCENLFNKKVKKHTNIYDFLKEDDLRFKNDREVKKEEFPLYKTLKDKKEIKNEILSFKVEDNRKYICLSSFPILENDEVVGGVVAFSDITEDYLSKIKLKKEKQKFINMSLELKTKCDVVEILRNREKTHLNYLKNVINNISEGILVYNKNNTLGLCNDMVHKMLGLTRIELVGYKRFNGKYQIYDLEDNKLSLQYIKNKYIVKHIPLKNFVVKLLNKEDESIKYIEFNSNPIFNVNKEIVYTIITMKDVTETKTNQIIFKKQAKFIESVVNNIDIPIAVIEYPSFKYKLVNKEYIDIMNSIGNNNFSHKFNGNIIGRIISDRAFPFLEKGEIYKRILLVAESVQEYSFPPYKIEDPEGRIRFCKIKLTPYQYEGKTIRIHIHATDVTDEVNRSLQLEKLNRLKDRFFTVISHELRTPLTIIYSSLQLAYDVYGKEVTPNINKTFERINQNCGRLLRLINNIMDISKIEAGLLDLNNSEFDIVSESENIIDSVNFYAQNKGIGLIFDTNLEEEKVVIDKGKYEKIVLNLLSNAIKFTPEGKKVIVTLDVQKDFLNLSVKDQGIGIPKGNIKYIFSKYAQLNSSLSRRAEGTGLGLALVKKIVDLMSGTIKVQSEVGKGSIFKVKLAKYFNNNENERNYSIVEQDLEEKINIEFSDIN